MSAFNCNYTCLLLMSIGSVKYSNLFNAFFWRALHLSYTHTHVDNYANRNRSVHDQQADFGGKVHAQKSEYST